MVFDIGGNTADARADADVGEREIFGFEEAEDFGHKKRKGRGVGMDLSLHTRSRKGKRKFPGLDGLVERKFGTNFTINVAKLVTSGG